MAGSCVIDLSFDLDDALSMPIPIPTTTTIDVSLLRREGAEAPSIDDIPTVVIPDELGDEQEEEAEASCSICMDNFQVGIGAKQVPCGHVYHRACIASWLSHSNSCPLCRTLISPAPYTTIGNSY